MQVTHVTDYIQKNYGVTDKADGERYLLYVFAGTAYVVSMNAEVLSTGMSGLEALDGTTADGECLRVREF